MRLPENKSAYQFFTLRCEFKLIRHGIGQKIDPQTSAHVRFSLSNRKGFWGEGKAKPCRVSWESIALKSITLTGSNEAFSPLRSVMCRLVTLQKRFVHYYIWETKFTFSYRNSLLAQSLTANFLLKTSLETKTPEMLRALTCPFVEQILDSCMLPSLKRLI